MAGRHICGCYFTEVNINHCFERFYLPQTELRSHTTITPVCFNTKLQQKFSNTREKAIKELRYTFPLYDGVSVGAYTIRYGDKQLKGVVKQKDDARKTYQEAVDRGETAGLLESLPAGIFGVTIGNVPPHTDIYVDIEYIGELKHDAGIDGLRYTLPTSIAPRYGSYPHPLLHTPTINKDGIKVTLDIDMAGSAIRKIQSPTHPIAITMGNLATGSASDTFSPSKGSATLTQGSAELAGDFVLQLYIDDISKPQAIVEKHPTVDSRAIMATLVPKFNLPLSSPEIVFIADQSGSMRGSKNDQLKAALKIFLKSLPFGVRFNICAFGSSYRYLWAQSQPYNEDNLKTAADFVDALGAQYGGTEMLEPVKQAFLRRLSDLPLEVMLLTDGEIWQEQLLFEMINQYVHVEGIDARVFGLGIGNDVSHTLVEGVARAGNGFAQFVGQDEDADAKIVRMLRASLFPHTKDYTLEVSYGESMSDDGFELIEKVTNKLSINDQTTEASQISATSFFDESIDIDAPPQPADRYAHLPAVTIPKVLQAPTKIAPLFPYNRSTIYLILGADAPKQDVVSITLRAQGPSGPLELKVPVHNASSTSTTVHQLAARKATQELEEGRGWVQEAKTTDGYAVEEKYKSRLDELVEREAVRLGVTYQVVNKWCSFVAVQDGTEVEEGQEALQPFTTRRRAAPGRGGFGARVARPMFASKPYAPTYTSPGVYQPQAFSVQSSVAPLAGSGLFGAAQPEGQLGKSRKFKSTTGAFGGFGFGSGVGNDMSDGVGSVFGSKPSPAITQSFGNASNNPASALFTASTTSAFPTSAASGSLFGCASSTAGWSGGSSLFGLNNTTSEAPSSADRTHAEQPTPPFPAKLDTPADRLRAIIGEQTFAGSWRWTDALKEYIEAGQTAVQMDEAHTTALVLAYLRTRLTALKDVWELVAEKAIAWLDTREGKERSDEMQKQAGIAY